MSYINEDFLAHHGILGMKWGVRRYQNEDGSLTVLGRQRYGYSDARRDYNTKRKEYIQAKKNIKTARKQAKQRAKDAYTDWVVTNEEGRKKAKRTKETMKFAKLASKYKENNKRMKRAYDKYRANGLTDQEAKALAVKKYRTQNAVGIALGTVAATALLRKPAVKAIDAIVKQSPTTIYNLRQKAFKNLESAYNWSSKEYPGRLVNAQYGKNAIHNMKQEFARSGMTAPAKQLRKLARGVKQDIRMANIALNNANRAYNKGMRYNKMADTLKKFADQKTPQFNPEYAKALINTSARTAPIEAAVGIGLANRKLKKSESSVGYNRKVATARENRDFFSDQQKYYEKLLADNPNGVKNKKGKIVYDRNDIQKEIDGFKKAASDWTNKTREAEHKAKSYEDRAKQYQREHPDTNMSYTELIKKAKKGQI